MEKLVFAFRRKPGWLREDFHQHYVQVHAPLGLRANRMIERYFVNLVLDEASEFDAVTEVWTPSVKAFMSRESFVDKESAQALISDHLSFMGPQDAYVVEERPAPGFDPPAEGATKSVRIDPERPARGSAIDNVVLRQVYRRDIPVDNGTPSAAQSIQMTWSERPVKGWRVAEHRFRP